MSRTYKTPTLTLGEVLRERRQALGISMLELAQAAGVSRTTVHRIENPTNTRPSADSMARVLAALQVTEDEAGQLIPGDDESWRNGVLRRLRLGPALAAIYYAQRPASGPSQTPTLVATENGSTTQLFVSGEDSDGTAERLAQALTRAGFLVSRPV